MPGGNPRPRPTLTLRAVPSPISARTSPDGESSSTQDKKGFSLIELLIGVAIIRFVDAQLASGTKSGYSFTLSGTYGTPNATYQIRADPLSPNQTGVRYFVPSPTSFVLAALLWRIAPPAFHRCNNVEAA